MQYCKLSWQELYFWCYQGSWIHHWYLCFLFSLAYSSEKSQEILKNLSKALKKHLERDSLLEEIKVFNQDFSKCRKTGTVLVLKSDTDFITLWDDPIHDGSVTIMNVLELLKQTALVNADKFALVAMIVGSERDAFNSFVNN